MKWLLCIISQVQDWGLFFRCLVSGSGAIRAAAQTPGSVSVPQRSRWGCDLNQLLKRGTTSLQPEPQNWIKTVFKKKKKGYYMLQQKSLTPAPMFPESRSLPVRFSCHCTPKQHMSRLTHFLKETEWIRIFPLQEGRKIPHWELLAGFYTFSRYWDLHCRRKSG